MSTSTQRNLVNRRTALRAGWVWSVDHIADQYSAAAAYPTFAIIEGSKRMQPTLWRAPNA
jgi:hypothetical protein